MPTDELRELYQEVILDHSKNPRNFHELSEASHEAKGHNPLCGDRLSLYLVVADGVIQDVAFQGAGCAISTASASMMTQVLKGKTEAEAEKIFRAFHDLVTGKSPEARAQRERSESRSESRLPEPKVKIARQTALIDAPSA